MSKLLSREDILNVKDLVEERVDVPEWGGLVIVRCMTGAERDAFEASILEVKGKKYDVNLQNMRAKLIAHSVVDQDGKPLFKESDVRALGQKSAAAMNRIYEVAQRLSGISKEDVEELAKNSGGAQSDGSGSD